MFHVFSYGGGTQSTAALVLAAQGKIDFPTFLFCNVGDDSEHPDTLRYVHDVAMPYARAHGITLHEVQRVRKDGSLNTLYQQITRPGSRSIGIPVRMNGNGAPGRRSCTYDFKIAVFDKWMKEHWVNEVLNFEQVLAKWLMTNRESDLDSYSPAAIRTLVQLPRPLVKVGIGISMDEIQRMKPNMDEKTPWKENVFPLIMDVLRPMTRIDCMHLIESVGLPLPPKSACTFCPYHTMRVWQQMRQHEPALFWKAVELERFINARCVVLGMDPVWFCRKLKPLDESTTELSQDSLFDSKHMDDDETADACESGLCFV